MTKHLHYVISPRGGSVPGGGYGEIILIEREIEEVVSEAVHEVIELEQGACRQSLSMLRKISAMLHGKQEG